MYYWFWLPREQVLNDICFLCFCFFNSFLLYFILVASRPSRFFTWVATRTCRSPECPTDDTRQPPAKWQPITFSANNTCFPPISSWFYTQPIRLTTCFTCSISSFTFSSQIWCGFCCSCDKPSRAGAHYCWPGQKKTIWCVRHPLNHWFILAQRVLVLCWIFSCEAFCGFPKATLSNDMN